MRVLLLNNPNSGRGTGAAMAASLGDRLREARHVVLPLAAGRELDPVVFKNALSRSDLLVIAGGDGTLHHALPAIIESGTRFYHYPLGTENLFTREFGMDQRAETLLRTIERGRVRVCDAGLCNGRHFSLMVGVGFDAGVVERLAARRSGGTTRAEYVRHAVQELINPRVPHLTVRVDDRVVVDHARGMLIVANSRQYAARLDPARHADMSDGQLDVVFYPHTNAAELVGWLLATAAGSHADVDGLISASGERVRVEMDAPGPHQIDGEAAGPSPALDSSGLFGFDIRVLPGVLNVLVP
jgi:diacylglycerol kinase (ATP)